MKYENLKIKIVKSLARDLFPRRLCAIIDHECRDKLKNSQAGLVMYSGQIVVQSLKVYLEVVMKPQHPCPYQTTMNYTM